MGSQVLFMSSVFGFVSLVYILIALYGLSLNFESRINRVFFLMGVSLSIWGYSYSVSTSADTPQIALLFNRISVLGWGFFYAFLLHFTKLLANGNKKISKKYYFLIYSPSILFTFVFGLLDSAISQCHIVLSTWGYTNVAPPTFLNHFFNVYCAVFAFLSVRNTIQWYNRTGLKKIVKLVKMTVVLSVLSILFSFLSDVILVRLLGYHTLQLTIIWLFPSVLCMFYAIVKGETLHSELTIDIDILNESDSYIKSYNIIGYTYVFVSYVIYFLDYLFSNHRGYDIILLSVSGIMIGCLHFFLSNAFKNGNTRNLFLTLLYMIKLGFISFIYYPSVAVTIWGVFLCYLALTSLFKSMKYSYFMIIFMLLVTAFYWYTTPEIVVTLTWRDYFGRIGITMVFSFLILYINSEYRKKQEINIKQIEKQKTISYFSRKVIDLSVENSDEKTFEFLGIMNEGFNISRSYYIQLDEEGECSRTFFKEGNFKHLSNNYDNTIFSINEDWLKEVKEKKEILVWSINSMDSIPDSVKQAFEERKVNAFYAAIIEVESKLRSLLVAEFVYSEESVFLSIYKDMFRNLIIDSVRKMDAERELLQIANFDDVTGLRTRVYFAKSVSKILAENKNKSYYVIYLDIDNFKTVNDTFGHVVGDKVLVSVAQLLERMGKDEDVVTRISSDEFVIFCDPSYDKEEIEEFSKNIVYNMKNGLKINDNNFRLNISIGISHYPEDGDNLEMLVKNADIAMHKSKDLPYKKYRFCEEGDKEQVIEDAKYTDKLYYALANEEFFVVYQPQVSLKDHSIVGAEALLRWESKDFGMVSPVKFVPILERTGLIVEVGEYIIVQVIKEQLKMKKMGFGNVRFSINLSVVQFLDTSFLDKLENILDKYDVDPEFIEFELTESIAINDNSFVIDSFTKLKKMGFSIAIDDFGTGYSSLNRLQQLPIDRLKIDKSFVDGIGKLDKRESIVNIVIEFAKILGLTSIAEGTENLEQVNYLREHSCDEVQGYYFAKPMKSDDFEDFIRNYKPE